MSEFQKGSDAGDATREPNVAYMEQALWHALLDDQPLSTARFFEAWLALQCRDIEAIESGLLLTRIDGDLETVTAWQSNNETSEKLMVAAASALAEGRPVMRTRREKTGGANKQCTIAVPITKATSEDGALVVSVSQKLVAGIDPRKTIRQLQWGAAWVRYHLAEAHSKSLAATKDKSALALTIASSCLSQNSFSAATQALSISLSRSLKCDRVAIGMRNGQSTTLKALSNNADFSGHMALVRYLEAAMDEAIDQRTLICFPEEDNAADFTLRHSHEQLVTSGGAGHAMTVPIFIGNECVGAITLERPKSNPFSNDDAELTDTVSSLVAPFLVQSLHGEKWFGRRLAESTRDFLKSLLGPQHYARKAIGIVLTALAAISFLATPQFAFDATAAIEGRIKRVVTAPIDGYIQTADKRAGDIVAEGDTLATLDDRELKLQLEGWQTVKRQRQREFDRALAEADRSAIRILQAQIAQADAQIGSLNAQLARTRLIAPFEGLVVSGDLAQSIGGAVQRGEILFEIAPDDGYRVVLLIEERDLDQIAIGQKGRLLLSTYPDQSIAFDVVRVTPVAEVRDGKNVFLAEATLEATALQLRPGMEGVAKIEVGPKRLIWIWTNELNETIRLALWRFWG